MILFPDEDNVQRWTDFLKFLFECSNSDDPSLKESALHIFRYVMNNIPVCVNLRMIYCVVLFSSCFKFI